jgi:hypothetical protein
MPGVFEKRNAEVGNKRKFSNFPNTMLISTLHQESKLCGLFAYRHCCDYYLLALR